MARSLLRLLQVITFGVFIWTLVTIISAFPVYIGNPGEEYPLWDVLSIARILGALKNFLSYFIYFAMAAVSVGIVGSTSEGVGGLMGISHTYRTSFTPYQEPIIFQHLNMLFNMTNENGDVVFYSSLRDMVDLGGSTHQTIFELLAGQGLTIVSNIYQTMFLLLMFMSFVYMLMFIGRMDIKYPLYSTVTMLVPIVLAVFPTLILNMLEMLNLPAFLGRGDMDGWTVWETEFLPVFRDYIPVITVDEEFMMGELSPTSFFVHRGVWIAFQVYIFLELSFQVNYIGRVTQPSLERTKRLEIQIQVLGRQSALFEEEEQERLKESGQYSTLKAAPGEERVRFKDFLEGGGVGVEAIKALIERREKERQRAQLEEISSDTRRLNSYLKRLMEIDREARNTLTATGSAPSQRNIFSGLLINMGIRIGLLLPIVYLVANPVLLFQVFNAPTIIKDSIGFSQPEAIVTSLVPLVLLFPLVSFIIRTYKRYKLAQIHARLEQESETLRKLSEIREIMERETFVEET